MPTIPATQGEVYIVLINDFGEGISTGGMQIDWSPSAGAVLFPPTPEVVAGDTAVCSGETVQIEVLSSVNSIQWVGSSAASLSCTNCFTPIAAPAETTTYQALIEAVCYTDTVKVTVQVFDVDAGPDLTVCRGEAITLEAVNFITMPSTTGRFLRGCNSVAPTARIRLLRRFSQAYTSSQSVWMQRVAIYRMS